jgi:penicillin amidase
LNSGGAAKLIGKSLKDAINWLREQFGSDPNSWEWGKLHQITWRHILGGKKPLDAVFMTKICPLDQYFAKVFNIGPLGADGDTDTPKLSAIVPPNYYGNGFNPTYKQIGNFFLLSMLTLF